MLTPEYYVRFVPFPAAVEGATVPNDDGTFDIYINSALPDARRDKVLRHELMHLFDDHFYRPDVSISAVERSADLGVPLINLPVRKDISQGASKRGSVRCFFSLNDLRLFAIQNGGI